MALRQPEIIPWALGAAALIALVVFLVWRRRRQTPNVHLANTSVLTALPEYVHALWLHRLVTIGYAAAAALVVVLAVLAAARPVATTVVNPEKANRDVVLCLDVSGSMVDADADIVATFRELAKGFKGERLSMIIFNSSAVPLFPLTDDYDFIDEQLAEAERAFNGYDRRYYAGTMNGAGSSLIGDGLATCVRSFDNTDKKRARSVILATDNYTMGKTIFTLPEGGQMAKERDIQIYGINPAHQNGGPQSTEMRTVCEDSGGLYYPLKSNEAVSRIIAAVTAREAGRIPGAPITLIHDVPENAITWTAVAALLLLATRRRWRA